MQKVAENDAEGAMSDVGRGIRCEVTVLAVMGERLPTTLNSGSGHLK